MNGTRKLRGSASEVLLSLKKSHKRLSSFSTGTIIKKEDEGFSSDGQFSAKRTSSDAESEASSLFSEPPKKRSKKAGSKSREAGGVTAEDIQSPDESFSDMSTASCHLKIQFVPDSCVPAILNLSDEVLLLLFFQS